MIPLPSADALLDVADRGRGRSWLDRGLVIAALTGADPAGLAGAPVGRLQDAVLLVHESLSGEELAATTVCPRCAAVVEFAIDVRMLRMQHPAKTSGRLDIGACSAYWRVPTAGDLRLATATDEAAAALRSQCITATVDGREVASSALPEEVVAEIERVMADADPLAEVLVAVTCPECGAGFDADLDPVGFVWAEIEARAMRLLREVNELACVYGWTENVVLALPAARRAAYLAIVRGETP